VAAPLEQGGARQTQYQHRHVPVGQAEVVQEVERGVVGEVQVVGQQHHRRGAACGKSAQQLGRRVKPTVADLLNVVSYAGDVLAPTEVQPDEMSQHVGACLRQVGTIVRLE
jgi:hypothetical protein